MAVTQQLLTSLEDVVARYRVFTAQAELTDLCAEAVTAEVAHHLAVARTSLSRHPALHPPAPHPPAPHPPAPRADASWARAPRTPTPHGRGAGAHPVPPTTSTRDPRDPSA
jgi:hypothetical protein